MLDPRSVRTNVEFRQYIAGGLPVDIVATVETSSPSLYIEDFTIFWLGSDWEIPRSLLARITDAEWRAIHETAAETYYASGGTGDF